MYSRHFKNMARETDIKKPHKGAALSAHCISYTVKVPTQCFRGKEDKKILSNVTGLFKQGLTAIMGPTGSGKSTFLDVLAGRKKSDSVSGKLLLDGMPVPDNFKCMVGYVVQDDTLMGTLSIRENLHFSAALRLPTSVTSTARVDRVNNVIKELGLTGCADTRVGTEFIRGVSGGERKRCNIGMELIISPQVLFLDEPTTGLDADTALTVILFLKKLSRRGRTIIFSIHQPRYSIYSLFDELLLLYEGCVLYSGPSHEVLDFFATQGFHCQIHNNPPDFFLDVINYRPVPMSEVDIEKGETCMESYISQGTLLVQGFRQSHWNKRLQEQSHAILNQFEAKGGLNGARHDEVQYATPFYRQFNVLAGRELKNILRSPQTCVFTIGASLVLAALVTAIFWQLKEDPISGFKDRSGVMFFLIINQLFFNMPAVDVFINERKIFMHENASGFYRVSVYFLVKILLDIVPLRSIPVVIMSCIVYFSIGLNEGVEHFFMFMFTLFCTTIAGAGLCFLISSTVRNFAIAQVFLALTCIMMMLFGGFLVSFDSIGPWLNWAQHVSIFKYALAALYINEFQDRLFCNTNATLCETGNNFLRNQQISFSRPCDLMTNHVALLSFAVGFLTLTYIQLRRMKKTP